jgi:hypothetical protein
LLLPLPAAQESVETGRERSPGQTALAGNHRFQPQIPTAHPQGRPRAVKHQYRRIVFGCSHRSGNLKAIERGQHYIQNDRVKFLLAKLFDSLAAVTYDLGLITLGLKIES